MRRAGGVLLFLTSVLLAEPATPRVVLLLTKAPPSSKRKFERAVARAFGPDDLDKEARKALRASYRWSEEPAVMKLPLGCRLELQVGRTPLDLKNAPKHRAWISLRALNRESVDSDYRRICRILSDYVEGNKSCTGVYFPEYRRVHGMMPRAKGFKSRLAAQAGWMRTSDPLVTLNLKKKPKPPVRQGPPPELSALQKAASKHAQKRWHRFVLAWNRHEKFTRRDYWVLVKYRGSRPGSATSLVKIENARNGRFYGKSGGVEDKTIKILPEDVVDWWYRDKQGKWVGKFVEQIACGELGR